MVYLGVNTIKSLVLGFSLVDMTRHGDGFDPQAYWRRCVYTSAAARRIAAMLRGVDPEEAFTVALLQDLGMLAMRAVCGPEYDEVLEATGGDHRALPDHETESIGFSHAEASAALAEKWKLPEGVVLPIRHHHLESVEQLRTLPPLAAIVSLAHRLASAIAEATDIQPLDDAKAMAAALHDWPGETMDELAAGIIEDAQSLSSLLHVDVGGPASIAALMAEAEDLRVAHSVSMQQQVTQLEEQALTDGLTNIANRKRFDLELAERFEQARSFNGALGIAIVDADRFKSVNDTHGHQAGDAVLVEIARRLSDYIRDAGLVCRYGGEEFAVILPGADREKTTCFAEGIRRTIAGAPFDVSEVACEADALDVTVSVGGAAFEPAFARVFVRGDVVVTAADRALYAAKQGGRNCVRVFKPRARAA
jgi:diguanylate cyclase (GGDEF)-like protein